MFNRKKRMIEDLKTLNNKKMEIIRRQVSEIASKNLQIHNLGNEIDELKAKINHLEAYNKLQKVTSDKVIDKSTKSPKKTSNLEKKA